MRSVGRFHFGDPIVGARKACSIRDIVRALMILKILVLDSLYTVIAVEGLWEQAITM